jgi:hypothetical protein
MTRFWLIILRIICITQLIAAIYRGFVSLIGLIQDGHFIYLLQAIAFAIIAALPARVFIIFSNNYPEKPIEGKQKRNFNRLFLINVLLVSFLFGFVFYDYQEVFYIPGEVFSIGGLYQPISYFDLILSILMLILHLAILYGLFWLRTTINMNANNRDFDFEMQDENA